MKLRRRWVRSWPAPMPATGRNYVVDQLPLLRVGNFDLADNEDAWTVLRDCTLLEWDVALSPESMVLWEAKVDRTPERVHVAPYRVYAGSGYGADDWLPPMGQPAERFGFGMIWFPAEVLDRFRAAPRNPHALWFTDGTFAAWYSGAYGAALAHWDVQPLHLNYRLELPPP